MVDQKTKLVPLDREARAMLPTKEAAVHLNRAEQTLHLWACKGNGLIQPARVGRKLAWPVAEIKRVLGLAA